MSEEKLTLQLFTFTSFKTHYREELLHLLEESQRVTAEKNEEVTTVREKVSTVQELIGILRQFSIGNTVLSGIERQVWRVIYSYTDSESDSKVEVSRRKTILFPHKQTSEKRVFNPGKIRLVLAEVPSTFHDGKIQIKSSLVRALERVDTSTIRDSNGKVDIIINLEEKS